MKKLPRSYMITDRTLCPKKKLLPAIKKSLQQGVRLIQLREKDLSTKELYELAKKIKPLCKKYHAIFLINTRVDLALALNLDGVHLPQKPGCLSLKEARLLLGPQKWLGQSTHSLKEALRAEKEGADFITFGPIHRTPSKIKLGRPLGFKQLQKICHAVKIPVYALGGLTQADLPQIKKRGAHGVAGIRTFIF